MALPQTVLIRHPHPPQGSSKRRHREAQPMDSSLPPSMIAFFKKPESYELFGFLKAEGTVLRQGGCEGLSLHFQGK